MHTNRSIDRSPVQSISDKVFSRLVQSWGCGFEEFVFKVGRENLKQMVNHPTTNNKTIHMRTQIRYFKAGGQCSLVSSPPSAAATLATADIRSHDGATVVSRRITLAA
ncbi:hypothetical protein BC938DRAFT_478683 [Jimgerdemannia flammicorona]|uniref:Uncharacterized protein n=1 Tax=Jimgerdemannia flammicorona TaxID=994334 RepID=A0A433P4X1_9FUNG|nr:hypothetical protein BC938DRAFT_478683 [Jimgerdemannia flammicorona]